MGRAENGRLLVVCRTFSAGDMSLRIISDRPATHKERRLYEPGK